MQIPTERMNKVPYIGIRSVFEKAKRLQEEGKKIIHMEIGRPDFDTPQEIKDAANNALQKGMVKYTSNFGMDKLRETIASKISEETGVETKDKEILVTPGAIVALGLAIFGLVDIEEEILIPAPSYPAYYKQAIFAGAIPVSVPLREENGFKLSIDDLEERVSSKTKMLIINSPHNPTGVMLDYEDLKKIADFVKKHDLILVSDECYETITYDMEHISMTNFTELKDRVVVINSTSKSFSMTGWRVGYIASNEELINTMVRVQQDLTICACSFAQAGAVYAYKNRDLSKHMLEKFKERKEIVFKYLDEINSIDYVKPSGAFYVFPSIKKLNMSSEQFCDLILEKTGVALVPGNAFGEYGEGFFRLAYSCSNEDLEEGLEKIKKLLNS